jgi:hypothetical protein
MLSGLAAGPYENLGEYNFVNNNSLTFSSGFTFGAAFPNKATTPGFANNLSFSNLVFAPSAPSTPNNVLTPLLTKNSMPYHKKRSPWVRKASPLSAPFHLREGVSLAVNCLAPFTPLRPPAHETFCRFRLLVLLVVLIWFSLLEITRSTILLARPPSLIYPQRAISPSPMA